MLKSMTGYGKGEFGNCLAEVRTVNHRFCEIKVKLPFFLTAFEEELKKYIKKTIKRGRVDLLISLPDEKKILTYDSYAKIDVDANMVELYKKASDKLAKILNKKNDLTLSFFINLPGVLKTTKKEIDEKKFFGNVKKAVFQALEKLEEMRNREGKAISNDFHKRIKKIDFHISKIKLALPKLMKSVERRLLTKELEEFLKDPKLKNEKKIINSALNVERIEITEELVRLKSHIEQFLSSMKDGSECGKKLEFIIQEMHREINTLGSKVNNYKLSSNVIHIKSELEKLKEQVQNIE